MRVEILEFDDLLQEIALEAQDGNIVRNIVRARTDVRWEQEEQITQAVVMWVTVLCQQGDDRWILEWGQQAGRNTEANGDAGDKQASEWMGLLASLCDEQKLTIRTGKYEVI